MTGGRSPRRLPVSGPRVATRCGRPGWLRPSWRAAGGVPEALAAAAVKPDVVVGPHGAELLAAGAQLADQGGEGGVERVAACLGAQQLDGGPGGLGEVGVEIAGGGVEEPEAGQVDVPAGDGEGRRVQGAAEGVGGEDVEAAVADEGGDVGHAVEDEPGRWPQLLRYLPAGGPGGAGVGGAGEIEQVQPLGLVELERAGDGLQHGVGDAGQVALFQARVVVGADTGEHGDFLAAQPGNAPVAAVEGQPGLLRGDPGAAGDKEVPHIGPVAAAHVVHATSAPEDEGGSVITRDNATSRARGASGLYRCCEYLSQHVSAARRPFP